MKRIHSLVAILLLCGFGASAFSQSSIADLARRERERKKALESKAVLTNSSQTAPNSSESGSLSVTAPSTTAAQKAPAKPATAAGPVDSNGHDEKFWRPLFDKARQDLKRAQDKLTLLDLRMNNLQAELYRESVYNREMDLRRQMSQTEIEQTVAREEVDSRQRRISELEDELRRSGGLPGWAR